VPLRKGVFLDLDTVDRGDLDRHQLAASLPRWERLESRFPAPTATRSKAAARDRIVWPAL
jgi:hypothetical protein